MKIYLKSSYQVGVTLIFALTCFALLPMAQAQLPSPAPDGGYANQNTAEGENALFNLAPNGVRNTAIGFNALFSNTGGGANTAVGAAALASNTANDNTAVGSYALTSNTTGSANTALGIDALMLNTIGTGNHAIGHDALFNNTTGNFNTATGLNALFSNTTGNFNTANGWQALNSNKTGVQNTATGAGALSHSTGESNTADGVNALVSNTTGSSNVAIGAYAGRFLTTGSGNVCIGANVPGVAGESNATRIRNVFASVVSGRAVFVNSDNKIGTQASSRRYKEEIKPMDKTSESLFALKPVTFRYKQQVDPERALSFGLIAEEVAEVSPDLVTRDEKGKPETVRYEAVNAMLLNEFLKEHRKVEQLEKQVEALTAGLQKVSVELEMNRSTPQTVSNNQ